MVTDPARMMEPGGVSGQSNPLLESARLDILLPNTRAHWGIIVGLVCVVPVLAVPLAQQEGL